jgi:tripartite ATP-independent transporter DctP family solute receptor
MFNLFSTPRWGRQLAHWGCASLVAGLMALGSSTSCAREIKGWSIHPEDYPVNQAMQQFADALGRVSAGKHQAKVYPDGSLAPQGTVLEKLANGEVDFAEIGIVGYGEKVPALQVLSTPYMFRDSVQMFELLDGRLGELLSAELAKVGVVLLGWYDGGTRNFYHRSKALARLADFSGEPLRVGNTQSHIRMAEVLGAKPVSLPFKEVYGALESGSIQGAENNLPSYESTGHYKLAPHYTFTRHLVSPEMLIMSQRAWAEFSPAQQQQLLAAGKASALAMRQLWAQRVESIRARLEKQGVTFHNVKDPGPILRRMAPLYQPLWQARDPMTQEALSLVLGNMAKPVK